jgi:glycosyl hydrolase family 42 (putative beta-galactosidase)
MRSLSRRDFLRLSALSTLAAPLLLNRPPSASAITPTPSPSPLPPASKSMRGLYAVMKRNDDAIPPEALAAPYVAGITLQLEWNQLQPTPTGFDWDLLDGAIQRVTAAGKKLALRPLAGIGSPAWLYRPDKTGGVKKFTFTPESDLYHPLDFGKEVSLPYPWDKTLIERWTSFVQALGARYDGEPALTRVAVSGPIFQQAEMYLPHSADVMTSWAAAGYSLNVIQAAWQKMLDVYAGVFHQTPFTLDLNPLPDPIDKAGATLNGLVPVAVGQYGLRRYPGRFFPAQSDLSDVYPWLPAPLPGPTTQPALYQSYERQATPIYQFLTATAKTFGVMISDKRMSRNPDHVKATVQRAQALKAAYIEAPAGWLSDADTARVLQDQFMGAVG